LPHPQVADASDEAPRMSARIVEARTPADRKAWVKFVFDHYRHHPIAVPHLLGDEISYFDPRKNPGFDASTVRLWMALDEDTVVGRICGILNPPDGDGAAVGRFGWFESIDDPEVAHALLAEVTAWLKAEGCGSMTGPHGFADLDPSGILIEGYDLVPTVAGSYHHAYYARLLTSFGLEKEVDYLEYRIDLATPVPFLDRFRKRPDRSSYQIVRPRNRAHLRRIASRLWDVLEESFAHLYGVVPLTEGQRRFYTRKYLSFLDPDFVLLGLDADGELIGFLIAMPNLSDGFRRAGGRLLPFGLLHVLRAYRRPRTVDLLLAGALSSEARAVLSARGLVMMVDRCKERGVRYLETNRELETNTRVNKIWRKFDVVGTRRLRVYGMELG
jgi:hypothetical protein